MTGTFVLGVGAQKAGTTWLHAYMQAAEGVDLGIKKEYHVWDGATVPELAEYRVRPLRIRRRVDALRFLMQRSPWVYFSYFTRLLARPGVTVTGDVTPSYAALDEATLRRIRDGFARRGVRAKAVFLMRDPVDRCWSAARMLRRQGRTRAHKRIPLESEADLLAYFRSEDCRARTEYQRTMARLEAVFEPGDIHYGIYETMFQPAEVAALSEFLGLPSRPEFVERSVHVGEAEEGMTEETRRRAAQEFREVYEACAARFPVTETVWPGARHL